MKAVPGKLRAFQDGASTRPLPNWMEPTWYDMVIWKGPASQLPKQIMCRRASNCSWYCACWTTSCLANLNVLTDQLDIAWQISAECVMTGLSSRWHDNGKTSGSWLLLAQYNISKNLVDGCCLESFSKLGSGCAAWDKHDEHSKISKSWYWIHSMSVGASCS